MEQCADDILMLTVRFLDLCQAYVLDGKIDIKFYRQLTSVKLDFVKCILESQKITDLDDTLQMKIDSIFSKDSYICDFKYTDML